MARVKRGFKARRRRNKILKLVKGFRGRRRTAYTVAKEAFDRSQLFAYRDRRVRKRDFRRLWIVRINAMVRSHGMSYSQFMNALKKSGCELDRRSLAEIAARDPKSFGEIVKALSADKAA